MSIKPAPRTVEPLVEAFATVLRRRRLAQDLSQEALARRADVSMRFVSLLELGRHMPTINTMQKLARGLGMPLSDLVREAEDEPPQESLGRQNTRDRWPAKGNPDARD